MAIHQEKPLYIDPRRGNIGKQPSAEMTGIPFTKAWRYLTQWHRYGSMAIYTGPPDKTVAANEQPSAHGLIDLHTNYHIVFMSPDRIDGENRIFEAMIRYWRLNWTADGLEETPQAEWYAPHNTLTPQEYSVGQINDTDPAHTYGDTTNLFRRLQGMEVPPHFGVMYHCKLHMINVLPAAIGIKEQPDSTLTDVQALFDQDHFMLMQDIEGRDDADALASMGQLLQRIDGQLNGETIERLTRRYLIAWAHGVGVWDQYDGDTGWKNLFNVANFKVKPRTLFAGQTHVECYPAFVITCKEDTEIEFVSGSDTWSWAATADILTPTMITYADGTSTVYGAGRGLQTAIAGDEIEINYKLPTVDGEMLVHSVYLIEGAPTIA